MATMTIDKANDLVVHVLNVGFGDTLIIELPPYGDVPRKIGIVDCCNATKAIDYIEKLNKLRPFAKVAFVCATHPHGDHISGIQKLLENPLTRPEEFWDSGFRHSATGYCKLLKVVSARQLKMVRISSGMEWYFGRVRVTALSPSVSLRNRFATYGVDMNNASIVLRLEHCADDVVNTQSLRYTLLDDPDYVRSEQKRRAVAILGGDAEFDSWACISQEYPYQEQDTASSALLRERKLVNLLACNLLKVSHHGSMHSVPLAVFEQMTPSLAVVSTGPRVGQGKSGSGQFPHIITTESLKQVGADVVTTDGTYSSDPKYQCEGTVIVALSSGSAMRYEKLADKAGSKAQPI